jgi:DNA-binding response OmpR family regulator
VSCAVIPVVILGSSDAERDKADAARFGASRYIRKPSRLDDFLSLGLIFKAALSKKDQYGTVGSYRSSPGNAFRADLAV